jgi:GNAT superfamily N-acetyltransferase
LAPGFDATWLSRIEDAGLNASAAPQQLWLDGWLVRTNPGKAKRARCVNAVATGRQPVLQKLKQAQAVFAEAGLPLVVRITPFSCPDPSSLDETLAQQGFTVLDNTRVMVCPSLPVPASPHIDSDPIFFDGQPLQLRRLSAADFAQAVGALRGSPADQRLAHQQRLQESPVPYHGYALCRVDRHSPRNAAPVQDAVLACGQYAQESNLVGLYDVYTRLEARRKGLAETLCKRLLSLAAQSGATAAYLQVEADNLAARRIYSRMGFVDAYGYHYRQAPQTPRGR